MQASPGQSGHMQATCRPHAGQSGYMQAICRPIRPYAGHMQANQAICRPHAGQSGHMQANSLSPGPSNYYIFHTFRCGVPNWIPKVYFSFYVKYTLRYDLLLKLIFLCLETNIYRSIVALSIIWKTLRTQFVGVLLALKLIVLFPVVEYLFELNSSKVL